MRGPGPIRSKRLEQHRAQVQAVKEHQQNQGEVRELEQGFHLLSLSLGLRLSRTFRPLPETTGHLGRQAIAQLSRRQNDLSPVMSFVGHEVPQDVAHVEREIAPDVRAGWWNGPVVLESKCQQSPDGAS